MHAHGALSPTTIALAARALGKHCVVTILGAGPPGDLARLRRKPAGRLRLALLARFASFIALSSEVATELRAAGVPATHATVIANGVDLTIYSPPDADVRAESRAELGLDPNRCYGVFVGRLHPVKGVDTLVRALVDTTGIDLLIVGGGRERARLERLACELHVGTRIRFIGSTPHVEDYLKVADAFSFRHWEKGCQTHCSRRWRADFHASLPRAWAASKNFSGTGQVSRSPSATYHSVEWSHAAPHRLIRSCGTRWAKPPLGMCELVTPSMRPLISSSLSIESW